MSEYVIWGILPGAKDEDVLVTKTPDGNLITRLSVAQMAVKVCIRKGATKVRIQRIDGSLPDFTGTINTRSKK